MRIVVAVLAALALVAGAGLAGDADAASAKKKHKQANAQERQASGGAAAGKSEGFVPRDAGLLPFGSSAWWEQMMRESRAGTCCN